MSTAFNNHSFGTLSKNVFPLFNEETVAPPHTVLNYHVPWNKFKKCSPGDWEDRHSTTTWPSPGVIRAWLRMFWSMHHIRWIISFLIVISRLNFVFNLILEGDEICFFWRNSYDWSMKHRLAHVWNPSKSISHYVLIFLLPWLT